MFTKRTGGSKAGMCPPLQLGDDDTQGDCATAHRAHNQHPASSASQSAAWPLHPCWLPPRIAGGGRPTGTGW